jgi:hypothetical protein
MHTGEQCEGISAVNELRRDDVSDCEDYQKVNRTGSYLIPCGLPVIEEGRCRDEYALEVESKEQDEENAAFGAGGCEENERASMQNGMGIHRPCMYKNGCGTE